MSRRCGTVNLGSNRLCPNKSSSKKWTPLRWLRAVEVRSDNPIQSVPGRNALTSTKIWFSPHAVGESTVGKFVKISKNFYFLVYLFDIKIDNIRESPCIAVSCRDIDVKIKGAENSFFHFDKIRFRVAILTNFDHFRQSRYISLL